MPARGVFFFAAAMAVLILSSVVKVDGFTLRTVFSLELSKRVGSEPPLMSLAERGSVGDERWSRRKKREVSGEGRWSDVQRGRRQEYSTLKSRGFAKELLLADLSGVDDATSISAAVGPPQPVVCPFDTTHICHKGKICPTDGRPCQSSRGYWRETEHAAVASTTDADGLVFSVQQAEDGSFSEEIVGQMHADGNDGVGELGAALHGNLGDLGDLGAEEPSPSEPDCTDTDSQQQPQQQHSSSFLSALLAILRQIGIKGRLGRL